MLQKCFLVHEHIKKYLQKHRFIVSYNLYGYLSADEMYRKRLTELIFSFRNFASRTDEETDEMKIVYENQVD